MPRETVEYHTGGIYSCPHLQGASQKKQNVLLSSPIELLGSDFGGNPDKCMGSVSSYILSSMIPAP